MKHRAPRYAFAIEATLGSEYGIEVRGLACEADGRFFVAPDNGVLTPVEVVAITVTEDAEGNPIFAPELGGRIKTQDEAAREVDRREEAYETRDEPGDGDRRT